MQPSSSSTRSFFRRPSKFKHLHRKQKSADSTTTTDSVATSGSIASRSQPSQDSPCKEKPSLKAQDVATEPGWTRPTSRPSGTPDEEESLSQDDSEDEPTPRKSEETMKISVKPASIFRGLPEYSSEMSSKKGLIDEEYLKAFGIKLDRGPAGSDSDKQTTAAGMVVKPLAGDAEKIAVETETSPTNAGEGLTELQIPPLKKQSPSNNLQTANAPPPQSSQIAFPPSEATRLAPRHSVNASGVAGAQMSIAPAPSTVKPPKQKRSLTSLSIHKNVSDEKKHTIGAPPMKSANSMSSNDTSEQDGRSSGLSERSSMSSVASEVTAGKDMPARRPVLVDATPLRVDTRMSQATSKFSTTGTPRQESLLQHSRPEVRRQSSSTSMRSVSTVNFNKPLPPEPPAMWGSSDFVQSPSRSSSLTVRPSTAQPDRNRDSASVRTSSIVRRSSKGSTSKGSIRSKYSTKEAERSSRSTPKTSHPSPSILHSMRASPSQSQTSLLPDQKLHTIKEDSPRDSRAVPPLKSPKQVSRGPMRMEPTRKPPRPPSQAPHRYNTVSTEKPEKKWFMKRSNTSNPGCTQVCQQDKREEAHSLQRRMTASGLSSASKANRVLGKSDSSAPVRPDLPIDLEMRRRHVQSQHVFSESESPSSMNGLDTPELDGRPDAHYEEIRKRLELLSPKDNSSGIFTTFHEKNTTPPTEQAESVDEAEIPDRRSPSPKPRREVPRQSEVAELEANRAPSPAELEGSMGTRPVEMGSSSPAKPATPLRNNSLSAPVPFIPVPPIPTEVQQRRGRASNSNPQSVNSAKCRSLHSQRSLKARSFASLAASDIPDIYAGLPTPPDLSLRPSMTAEEMEQLISADAAERVLLHILESLDNLKDLFAAALVSRGFYRTFKRNELHLLKRAIHRMSPAAWELREMNIPYSELEAGARDYTPKLYFRHYVQDLLPMVELKGMILESCKSFLRQETLLALAGEAEDRSPVIDEAFWRVWTFCRIFGWGNNREDDIVGQMDWLQGGVIAKQSGDTRTLALTDELARNSVLFNPPPGFARGNGRGLTAEELFDMIEIWTCLGVLVRVYQGKRKEAREFGLFGGSGIPEGDEKKENKLLEEWTHHLMTLGPWAILDVTSPRAPMTAMFAHARAHGYTAWTPPSPSSSRSTFLKEAVSRVYEDKLAASRSSSSASPKKLGCLPRVVTSLSRKHTCDEPPSPGTALASRQRVAQHAAELRAKKQDPTYKNVPVASERPMSNYRDVLDRLEALSASVEPVPPVPKLPSLAAQLSKCLPRVSISSPIREKVEAPAEESASSSAVSLPTPASPRPGPKADVRDPAVSPTTGKDDRFASLQDRVTGPGPGSRSGTPVEVSDEKVAVEPLPESPKPNDDARTGAGKQSKSNNGQKNPPPKAAVVVPRGPQVRDPVDTAVERLMAMGFDETRAKRALAETDSGNRINFENALNRLVKEQERQERLERLRKMG